jgi:hypothetical protein
VPASGAQELEADFFAVDFLAGAFLAVLEAELDELDELLFLAGAFLAVELLLDFFAVDELDELDFLAGAFLAGALLAVELLLDFFAVDELDEPDFFAGAFLAVEVDFFAVVDADFFAVLEVFLAVELDFFAVVDAFLAGAFFAVDDDDEDDVAFLAAPAALMAGWAAAAAAFLAGAVAFLATPAAFWPALDPRTLETARSAGLGSLGSFLAPDTTALRSAPAVNFGTAVFLAFTRSPVRGLRTHRASRTRFSKDPKPVMATFSPRATSRVMVSRTDSSACWACLRFPSYRFESASISWVLFTGHPFRERLWGRTSARRLPAR